MPAAGEPVYLVRRDLGRARDESPLHRVEPLTSLRDLGPAILDLAGDIKTLGLEFDVLPVANYQRYVRALPGVELRDCMPALRPLRARKSEWEVGRIRAAAEQIRIGPPAAPQILHAGMTDLELQIEIEHLMRSHGHQGPCRFRGMNGEMYFGAVLAGPDAAVPASSDTPFGGWGLSPAVGRGPRAGLITEGAAVSVDLVGAADGYLADATRTFSVGPLAEPLATALRVCEQILAEVESCSSRARPGRCRTSAASSGHRGRLRRRLDGIGRGPRVVHRPRHRARDQRAAVPRAAGLDMPLERAT